MTEPANEANPSATNNRVALRHVVRSCRKASLATLMADGSGAPYASLATVAVDHDLAPVLLLSGLSDHSRNIAADARVSLLFDGTDGHANPQTGPRVTLMGQAERCDDQRLKARFLARHPAAAMYAGFGDFAFWRIAPARVHYVGGFGRAVWFPAPEAQVGITPKASPFGIAPEVAAAVAAAEQSILDHMNADHSEALDLYAGDGSGWRLAGVDPDGIDLTREERFLRVAFPAPADGPAAIRAALVEMARRLRA